MHQHFYFPPGYPMTDGIPDYPLNSIHQNQSILDERFFDKLIKTIYDSIVNEANTARFYTRLLKEAPNRLHKDVIEHARNDELKHMQAFTQLYASFVGHFPHIRMERVQDTQYKEALSKAIKGEMEAVELYRDVQLSTTDAMVRDAFYMAMADEMEHASKFEALYNSL